MELPRLHARAGVGTPAARHRLLALLSSLRLRAVLSAHTHRYRDRVVDGVRQIWLPSTAFYLPDDIQDRVGEKITGLGVLDLSRGDCGFHLVCPDGVARNSALDYPIYPELVAARALGLTRLGRGGRAQADPHRARRRD